MALVSERCVQCRGGEQAMATADAAALMPELDPSWQVIDGHHLHREFTFPDFAAALAFTNRIGAIAEEQGHHPDIRLGWGRVEVSVWTHTIDGLTRNDFVLAAKIDAL